jgi:preprotein translocase subunit SecB
MLKVIDYVVPEVECRANPACPANPQDVVPPSIRVGNRLAVKENEEDVYRLSLHVEFGGPEEKCSYFGQIKVVGLFSIQHDVANKEIVLLVGGLGVLYGAAREFILSITSRGPNAPLMLPIVQFRPIVGGGDQAGK